MTSQSNFRLLVACVVVCMQWATCVCNLDLGQRLSSSTCNSTEQTGMQRQCSKFILNNINSSADCAAACCTHANSSPFTSDGCTAWSLNNWNQCFMCVGPNPSPPATSPAKPCVGPTEHSNCSTGIVTAPPAPPLPPAPLHGPLGGEASIEFVNYAHYMRWPSHLNGTDFAREELTQDGWPMQDCKVVLFDMRPTGAWAPPMDDPEQRQADLSGVWTLSFTGYAGSITFGDGGMKGVTIGTPSYDAASNTMTTTVTIAKGKYPAVSNLMVLQFNDTRATPASNNNTGFTNLEFRMPTYETKPTQLFSDNWAALMKPFDHLRWMGTTGTNGYSWNCGGANAAGCSVIAWEDRALPTYAYTGEKRMCKGCIGLSWETVLLAANELNKDIWINVPITASAPTVCRTTAGGDPNKCLDADPTKTYEYQLALLFKNGNNHTNNVGLKPNLNIYIEHSNEVWNFGFPQYGINKAFAMWEVQNSTKKSNLAAMVPGRPDINCTANAECWTHRRHARRVYEISQTFEKVFGSGSLNKRIRMVYASWTINEQEYFNNTFAWLESEVGPVNKFLYAISAAQYFGPHAQDASGHMTQFNYSTATIPEVIAAFIEGADANVEMTYDYVQFAKTLGVKTAGYESGPGYAVGGEKPGSKGLNTMIEASRNAGMKDAIVHDVRETVWRHGWDIYNYFAIQGPASRYGCWGATEDWKDINPGPPKLQAIYNLTGVSPTECAQWALDPKRFRTQKIKSQ
eukprot:m.222362 g.222362  ORF g.222362 m.222362 type:complete len:742 (-) comp33372_c1_seq1:245-2470(-)